MKAAMFSKAIPLNQQVENYVRERIVSGEYAPGTRLPSTAALAKITGVSVFAVQSALARLAAEGLLDRTPRCPTYVRGKKPVLVCAGIYFNRPLSKADSSFYDALGRELRQRLAQQGVKTRFWLDEREESEQGTVPESLKHAMSKREIQALIVPLTCRNELGWLEKVPVPSAILTDDPSLKNGVMGDAYGTLQKGLGELKRQGCRTVGVITNIPLSSIESNFPEAKFYRSLVDVLNECEIQTTNDWILYPQKAIVGGGLPQFGYEQFHALWAMDKRPEGLLVYPDVLATGVITAILELRLDIPRELKLVFHRNDQLPYLCPFPVAFLHSEVGRYADELIGMIRRQLDGGEPQSVVVPTSIVC